MANLLYNEVSDAAAKASIEFIQNLEEWLLEMLEAMEANEHNKIMAESLGKITSIPVKDLEEFECFTFDGTNTDVARAILQKYNIDTDHIGMKDGKVYCAFKRGRNLEGYKKLQFDIENDVIDVEKIYEEYLHNLLNEHKDTLSEEDYALDDDLDEIEEDYDGLRTKEGDNANDLEVLGDEPEEINENLGKTAENANSNKTLEKNKGFDEEIEVIEDESCEVLSLEESSQIVEEPRTISTRFKDELDGIDSSNNSRENLFEDRIKGTDEVEDLIVKENNGDNLLETYAESIKHIEFDNEITTNSSFEIDSTRGYASEREIDFSASANTAMPNFAVEEKLVSDTRKITEENTLIGDVPEFSVVENQYNDVNESSKPHFETDNGIHDITSEREEYLHDISQDNHAINYSENPKSRYYATDIDVQLGNEQSSSSEHSTHTQRQIITAYEDAENVEIGSKRDKIIISQPSALQSDDNIALHHEIKDKEAGQSIVEDINTRNYATNVGTYISNEQVSTSENVVYTHEQIHIGYEDVEKVGTNTNHKKERTAQPSALQSDDNSIFHHENRENESATFKGKSDDNFSNRSSSIQTEGISSSINSPKQVESRKSSVGEEQRRGITVETENSSNISTSSFTTHSNKYEEAKEAAYEYADTKKSIERAEKARKNQGDGFDKAEFKKIGDGNSLSNIIRKPLEGDSHNSETIALSREYQKATPDTLDSQHASVGPNGVSEDNSHKVSSFTIDRIDTRELTRRVQNLSDVTSKPYENPVNKAYRATENYRGKQSLSGLHTYISESAHRSLEKHRSSAFIAGLAYSETVNGIREGMPQVINNFIIANGYKYEGFQSRSSSRATMESFNKAMLNRKLITYDSRNNSYDYSKFNIEIERARSGKTKAERDAAWLALGKKLGIINLSAENCKNQIEQLAQVGRNINSYEEANKQKNKDKASLKQLTKKKLFGETELYKGISRLKLLRSRAEATYMVAKRAILIQAKVAAKMVCLVPPVRMAKKKIVVANEERKAKREELRTARKAARNEKAQERKKTRTEKKNARHEKKLRRSGIYKATDRFKQNISAVWQKAINSRFTRMSMAAFHKSRQIFHTIMQFSPASLAAKFLDFKATKKRQYLKLGICAVGVIVLASCVISIISASTTSITAFFTSDDDDIMNSNMGKAYTAVMNTQDKWVKNMKDAEISSNYFARGSLKFTDKYISASEYAEQVSHVVSYDKSSHSFYVNPFDFEPNDTSIYKEVKKFDGGTEVYIIGKSDPEKTGNIKEILAMASVYFENDTDSTDSNTESTKTTHYDQATGSDSGYFDEDEEEEDKTPARGFKKYVKELFKQSHQTVVELEYVTLPTVYSIKNNSSVEDKVYATSGDHLLSYDIVSQCSDYDKGGCTEFKGFYYRKTSGGIKIGVYGKDEMFHPLDNSVYPTSPSCYMGGSFEGTASISNLEAVLNSNTSCYVGGVYYPQNEVTYSSWNSNYPNVTTNISSSAINVAKRLGEEGGTYQNARFEIIDTPGGFTYYLTIDNKIIEKADFDHGMQPVYDKQGKPVMEKVTKIVNGKKVVEEVQKYEREIVTEYRIKTVPCHCYVIWQCAGNHSGRFCGGHLKAKITGLVYASTKGQSDEDNAEIEGKVEEGEYTSKGPIKTSIDKNKLSSAEDIFDIDQLITHSTEQEGWNGWTQDNMSLAMLKYNQDWEGLYGFDISNGLGGPGHPFGNPFHANWKTDPSIVITEYFGPRVNPVKGTSEVHQAIDIAAPAGTPIYSICKGTVTFAGYKSSQGNYVTIQDEEGYTVHYMHMSKIMVTEGQSIEEGEQIGAVGTTGDSTGNHLHLGIHHVLDNGTYEYINPIFFVSQSYFSDEEKSK